MIYTSYFSSKKYKKYNKEDGISIARYNKFWQGETYPNLFPSANLLAWWKSLSEEAQKCQDYQQMYFEAYKQETLSKLDPHKVAAELDGKVLLCFEKSEDFCHRHIIAAWLQHYGYEINEL
jgi:uncharacterized protein (DUF488 family)